LWTSEVGRNRDIGFIIQVAEDVLNLAKAEAEDPSDLNADADAYELLTRMSACSTGQPLMADKPNLESFVKRCFHLDVVAL
jgi:hypothetical protein